MSGRAWAYAGAALGGAVSVAANEAHSYVPPAGARPDWHPQAGAVAIAAFWPVALLLALEILARNPLPRGLQWVLVRLGLVPVAAVAAVVSYRHMSGLLAWYGEERLTAVLGPLAVDGLMVMAAGVLLSRTVVLDIAGQVSTPQTSTPVPVGGGPPDVPPVRLAAPVGVATATPTLTVQPTPTGLSPNSHNDGPARFPVACHCNRHRGKAVSESTWYRTGHVRVPAARAALNGGPK